MKLKTLLLALCASATLTATAKKQIDAKYLKGAVPEQNGIVTFTRSFRVPGKTQADLHKTIAPWAKQLVNNSIPAPGNYARVMGNNQDSIVLRACEWIVFKKKFACLDRTRMRYQLTAVMQGDRVTLTVMGITYYYGEDEDMTKNVIYKAEEWISDKEAVNKAGTRLYPKSGKFRRKTIDRMEELFESAIQLFETPEQTDQQPKRNNVVED